ncbi:hypothetical protein P170DRAFT_431175 [Aspergillus steynii IBT 23096]|uniref:RTA1 domain protein n=1 Tax=Aspergillus steynii IBT 23096 TaxID=1392250 RepID=A0A2I2FRI6_9EURO|nr:uncharacterized protein P170DRAFT_431175 [Aspergillus steynii IBT 23096]PLB43219.1 hypothetical protein P170DRAFT_431175 [Aspergillus steynii IBT 23096]
MSDTAYYVYTPNPILAIIGVGVYCTLTAMHIFRVTSTKAWDGSFMALGSFFLAMGCGARIMSSHDIHDKGAWAAQKVLLLWGPNMLMFTVHLSHAEFVKALHAEKHVFVGPRIARPLYFALNTVLFLLMMFSIVMLVTTSDDGKKPLYTTLVKASLIIQLIFWLVTFVENAWLSIRLRRHPTTESIEVIPSWKRWNQLFGLAISILAMGHNVVQMQMLGEAKGFMASAEWAAYAFDIYQSGVVLLGWGIWYLPGRCRAVVGRRKKNWGAIQDEAAYSGVSSYGFEGCGS